MMYVTYSLIGHYDDLRGIYLRLPEDPAEFLLPGEGFVGYASQPDRQSGRPQIDAVIGEKCLIRMESCNLASSASGR